MQRLLTRYNARVVGTIKTASEFNLTTRSWMRRARSLTVEIRRDHSRKSNFMPGFNAIVAGKRAQVEPSFLDRARWRWVSKTKA